MCKKILPLFTPSRFAPILNAPLSLKNKLELNKGEPSYCYSTTNLRLADFGKVIRLKSGGWEVFLRLTLTFPLLS